MIISMNRWTCWIWFTFHQLWKTLCADVCTCWCECVTPSLHLIHMALWNELISVVPQSLNVQSKASCYSMIITQNWTLFCSSCQWICLDSRVHDVFLLQSCFLFHICWDPGGESFMLKSFNFSHAKLLINRLIKRTPVALPTGINCALKCSSHPCIQLYCEMAPCH